MHRKDEKYIKFFSHKTGGNRPLGKTGCRWKYSMKMILKNLCELWSVV